jgi:hypothetical protein
MKIAQMSLCLCFVISGFAQSEKDSAPANSVTVTGCLYKGVECLTLKDATGKQDYSIAATEGKSIAFEVYRTVSELYLVEGLK